MARERKELLNLLDSDGASADDNRDAIIVAASFILHDDRAMLESALEILDHNDRIRCVKSSTSSRKFWLVPGSRDQVYVCFEGFCPCRRFVESLKQKASSEILCKHLIAISLAGCMKMQEDLMVSDEEFVRLMCRE
jgi:predicted nucleic acid-binding Zn finger protein